MNRLATSIADFLHKENPNLRPLQVSIISFGLECLLSELSKFLTYFAIFWILSLHLHYWTAVAFICIPRLLAGGYHSNTYWGCFFVTLIGISIAVFGGVYFEMSIYTKYIIFIISVIITVIYAPIDHFNKPIISVERRKRFKLYSIASFLFFGSLSLMIESELSAVGLIGLMIEAISLPAGYYLQRWDKT